MREIKFRVWDKLNDQMLQVSKLDVLNSEVEFNYEDTLPFEEVELMQYTGLKDKNGKEVYEGDILHITDDSYDVDNLFKVIWERGLGGFVLNSIDGTEKWRNGEYEYVFCHLNCINYCEVMGNIYENPNLLEV